jgi:hypothetical protein
MLSFVCCMLLMLSVTYKAFMVSVVMLNVVMLSVLILRVVKLSAVMLNVVMLSVIAPLNHHSYSLLSMNYHFY